MATRPGLSVLSQHRQQQDVNEAFRTPRTIRFATFVPSHLGRTVSREDVQQNVLVAQQNGSLHWISRGYPATYPLVKAPVSNKSRQQVLDELQAAQKGPATANGVRDLGGEIGWVEAHQAP